MGVGEMGGTRSTHVTDTKLIKTSWSEYLKESGLTEVRVSAGLV
jgi:hypothetical protein